MKKILALSILVSAALALHSQSQIGSQLKSKEAIILYLIEQEKVAHDLYRVLDTMWVTDVFNRVANEELQHMSKLSAVACEFAIDVPAHFNEYPEGQFIDEKLRRLYVDLLVVANFSLEEAYRACANLEERKILDLKAALKQPNFDVENLTYKALLIGAEDNLKLFIRELLNINTGYTPVWLSMSEYEALTKNILPNDGWKNTDHSVKTQSQIGLF